MWCFFKSVQVFLIDLVCFQSKRYFKKHENLLRVFSTNHSQWFLKKKVGVLERSNLPTKLLKRGLLCSNFLNLNKDQKRFRQVERCNHEVAMGKFIKCGRFTYFLHFKFLRKEILFLFHWNLMHLCENSSTCPMA